MSTQADTAKPVAAASPAWPLPWQGGPGAVGGQPGDHPPVRWPTLGQLTYTKEAITVLLLILALPWLVSKLLTRPGDVLTGLGRRAAGRVTSA
ncbi:MAG TPA: hypothetical protein VMY78_09900 [Solirubrobacteraceae bacterium]|nr:hypothetical protein [Solirubrobacteraceae bacterium]